MSKPSVISIIKHSNRRSCRLSGPSQASQYKGNHWHHNKGRVIVPITDITTFMPSPEVFWRWTMQSSRPSCDIYFDSDIFEGTRRVWFLSSGDAWKSGSVVRMTLVSMTAGLRVVGWHCLVNQNQNPRQACSKGHKVKPNRVRCPTLQSHISSMKKLQGNGSPCLYWPVSGRCLFPGWGRFWPCSGTSNTIEP